MKFQENTPLGDKNSLRLAANARWFCRVSSVDDVFSAASFAQEKAVPIIMLGSGTNIVLMQDLDALVVENGLLGKTVADGLVTVASGENSRPSGSRTLGGGAGNRAVRLQPFADAPPSATHPRSVRAPLRRRRHAHRLYFTRR